MSDFIIINDIHNTISDLFLDIPTLNLLNFGFCDHSKPLTDGEKKEATNKFWSKQQPISLLQSLQIFVPEYSMPNDIVELAAHCALESNSLRPLLQLLAIPRLSDNMTRSVWPQNERSDHHPAFDLLVDTCLVIQRWIHAKDKQLYAQLTSKNNSVVDVLDSLQIITVDTVVLEHRLKLLLPVTDLTRKQTVLCLLLSNIGAEKNSFYISCKFLLDDGFGGNVVQVFEEFVKIFFDNKQYHTSPDALVEFLVTWEGTKSTRREDLLSRERVPTLTSIDADPIWKVNPSVKSFRDDIVPSDEIDNVSRSLVIDSGELDTFSGGFDKRRKVNSNKLHSNAVIQFPAPEHLEVVVAEEDYRTYKAGSAEAKVLQSNVIFPPMNLSQVNNPVALSINGSTMQETNGLVDASALLSASDSDQRHGGLSTSISGPTFDPDSNSIVKKSDSNAISSLSVKRNQAAFDKRIPIPQPKEAKNTFCSSSPIKSGTLSTPMTGANEGIPHASCGGGVAPLPRRASQDMISALTVQLSSGTDFPEGFFPAITPGIDKNSGAQVIGRLGEEVAWQILRLKSEDDTLRDLLPFNAEGGTWSINWVNKEAESLLPYDLLCTHPIAGSVYVEVKATSSTNKGNFEISTAEVMAAKKAEEDPASQYIILRAYNVGSPWSSCRFDIIVRPWSLLQSGAAKLYIQL